MNMLAILFSMGYETELTFGEVGMEGLEIGFLYLDYEISLPSGWDPDDRFNQINIPTALTRFMFPLLTMTFRSYASRYRVILLLTV